MKYVKRSRSTRKFKKSYSKKRVFKARSKSLVTRVKKVEKKVRVLKPELKFRFQTSTAADWRQVLSAPNPVPTPLDGWFSSTVHHFCQLDEGVQSFQRVGRSIVPHSAYVKSLWTLEPPPFTETFEVPQDRYVRCVVCQTKSILNVWNDITIGGGRFILPYDDEYSSRVFTPFDHQRLKSNGIAILYDKVYKWCNASLQNQIGGAAPGADIGISQSIKNYTIRFKPKYPIIHDNDQGASLTNPIYVLWFTDLDDNEKGPTITLTSHSMWFRDNC